MRRLITLSLLALLIGLTGYQASASNERVSTASLARTGDERGAAAFPTGTWNAGIQVQNPTTSPATVQVKFYDSAGTLVFTTDAQTILAGGSQTYYLPDAAFSSLPNGKYSGVVESDQAVVAVVNETNYSGKGLADAYNGITQGSTTANLPLIFRNYSAWDSMIAVQNTDASTTANITLAFYAAGSTTPTNITSSIPPLASKTFDISSSAFDSLGTTFLGSLTVTSNTSVAAVAHSVKGTANGELTIYRAFTSGATRYLAPLVFNQYSPSNTNGWTSGIQVQNLGSTSDTITVDLNLSDGSTPRLTQTVAANSAATFYLPSATTSTGGSVAAGTYGSADIRSGSNQMVVIVNTTKYGTGVANAYNAFADGSGSTRVVAPLVYNKYNPNDTSGWTTGVQVQNLGTTADTITMKFKPTNFGNVSGAVSEYTVSLPVAASSPVTFYLPNLTTTSGGSIPAGLYGSAEFTSGSQKIIAVVNTTKYAANIATTYTGINQ